LYILPVDFVVYRWSGSKMNKPMCTYAIYKFYGVARIHFTMWVQGWRERGWWSHGTFSMLPRMKMWVWAPQEGWLFSSRGRDYCGLCTTIRACDRNIGIWKGYLRYVACVHLSRLTSVCPSVGRRGGWEPRVIAGSFEEFAR